MVYSIKIPKIKKTVQERNALGLSFDSYRGVPSTLCGGCGHDAISTAIMQACFELAIPPHELVKLSGIGCSSKTPAYFVSGAHAFNAVHGRMPAIATGAYAAHPGLYYFAVSGDGDTANIGLGAFIHAMKRQIRVCYLVENNGVFGLTKGQFSTTSDKGTRDKRGRSYAVEAMDIVALAIQSGASYVARGFSANKPQLVPLLKDGLKHKGFAFFDVLSPCVSFNNHEGSTKSYAFVRDHEQPLDKPFTDKWEALQFLQEARENGKIVTGCIYCDRDPTSWHEMEHTDERPLREIPWSELCPGADLLTQINQSLR